MDPPAHRRRRRRRRRPAEVLTHTSAALAAEADRLLPLLDDPDDEIRHAATCLLGHLPADCASAVLAALRERSRVETSPPALAGVTAAIGRLAPEGGRAWLTRELAADRPAAARAGAAWAIARYGLPWTEEAGSAVVDCWRDGEPVKGPWHWSDSGMLGDIALGVADVRAVAAMLDALLRHGTAGVAARAVAHDRCTAQRSARPALAPLLACAVDHPAPAVRSAAAFAVDDVLAAARLAADSLAARTAAQTDALADEESTGAVFVRHALDALIRIDDPRCRICSPPRSPTAASPCSTCSTNAAWPTTPPCSPPSAAVLEAGPDPSDPWSHQEHHNELVELSLLLRHWGEAAADAVDDLLPLVEDGQHWAVPALAAMGERARAAVPALRRAFEAPASPDHVRADCAAALATLTGDTTPLEQCLARLVADGSADAAARLVHQHDLDVEPLLPALRALAGGRAADTDRVAARLLHETTGETAVPLRAAAHTLERGRIARAVAEAADLAGRLGEAVRGLVPRLRALLGDPHAGHPAALALRRITGEAGPLLDECRARLEQERKGTREWLAEPEWLAETLRELGADAAGLPSALRALAEGDHALALGGTWGAQVRDDERKRDRLRRLLAAHAASAR